MEYQGFAGITGHEDLIGHLKNSIRSGKVSQAYLFTGEPGSGRKTLATLFAMALNCEEGGTEPCMRCRSCTKALSGNHPDIIRVTHVKPRTLSVEEIRSQVVNTAEILPYESRYKIYLIPDAELMGEAAQNALLKTLEDPPEYAVFQLIATSPEALLPTIRSRSVSLAVRAVRDDLVEQYLMNWMHVPDYEAKVVAALAQGNIGRAREAVRGETFSRISEEAIGLIKRVHDMRSFEFVEVIRRLKDERENIDVYLDLFLLWFRDVLLFKATRDLDMMIFKNELRAVQAQASGSSYEGIQEVIDAIERAKERLRANVNFDLVMELLFLTIRDNIRD